MYAFKYTCYQERGEAISLGTCALQQESLKTLSNPSVAYICMDCGNPARHNNTTECYQCDVCTENGGNNTNVVPISTSHNFKRVHHELASMGLVARLHISPVARQKNVHGIDESAVTLVEGIALS